MTGFYRPEPRAARRRPSTRRRARRAAARAAPRAAAGPDDRLRHAPAHGRAASPRRSPRPASRPSAYHAGMEAEERDAVQDWFMASRPQHRRGDDRLRHGHRQGRHPLRLPLQPAEEPGELRAGDRPRRPRRRAVDVCEMLACADDVPVLENFAYGDTPTREALAGLVDELLAPRAASSSTSPSYELSGATTSGRWCCDRAHLPRARRRPRGRARRSTPATASARRRASSDIVARFDEERAATSCARLFRDGKRAASGYARARRGRGGLGEPRERVVAALG